MEKWRREEEEDRQLRTDLSLKLVMCHESLIHVSHSKSRGHWKGSNGQMVGPIPLVKISTYWCGPFGSVRLALTLGSPPLYRKGRLIKPLLYIKLTSVLRDRFLDRLKRHFVVCKELNSLYVCIFYALLFDELLKQPPLNCRALNQDREIIRVLNQPRS